MMPVLVEVLSDGQVVTCITCGAIAEQSEPDSNCPTEAVRNGHGACGFEQLRQATPAATAARQPATWAGNGARQRQLTEQQPLIAAPA